MKIIKFLQSLWPAWIPYPSAWLQAFLMMLVAVGPMAVILKFIDWRLETVRTPFQLGIVVLNLIFGVVLAFIPYAYAYSFLLGESPPTWPKRLPSPKSLTEAMFGLSALVLSFSFGVGVTLLFVRIKSPDYYYYYNYQNYPQLHGLDEAATIGAIAWFIFAAYLYQAKLLTWRGMLQELRKKVENDLAVGIRPSEENPFSGLDLDIGTSKSTSKTPQKTPSRTSAKVPPRTVPSTQSKSRQTIKK